MNNSNNIPEITSKLAKAGWDGYLHFQQQWLEMLGVIKDQTDPSKLENPDLESFKAWIDVYEKEFRKFLTTPQLGLTRYYQERMREVLDKFNLFQAKMSEFTYSLFRPMEDSFKVMRERVEELTRGGKLPENPKEYYQMWIKILEDYYLNWFRSSEYARIMNGTLDALEEFTGAKQKFLQGFLQTLAVPSYTDLDDLSKDLYELKRRVKELAKKIDQPQP